MGAPAAQLQRSGPIADVDLWFGIDLLGLGTPPRQISIELTTNDGDPHYYGEVYEGQPGPGFVSSSYFDGTNYTSLQMESLSAGMHTGAMTLHVTARASSKTFTTEFGWIGESYQSMIAAPELMPVGRFDLFVGGSLVIDVRYLAVITTM